MRILWLTVASLLACVTVLAATSGRAEAVDDDFYGPKGSPPNPAGWSHATGTGWDDGVQNYTPDNAFLDGQGRLVIRAVKTGGGYTSGRVQTKNKASFGYGTLSARIKMPSGQGLWPAFWLVGADEDTTPWPQSGEIDVIELVSSPTTYYTTLHGPIADAPDTVSGTQQAQFSGPIADLSTDYHSYWVRHLVDEITVGIDGKILGTFTPASLPPGAQWVYNRPMYAILSLAIGGWAGPPDRSTEFPATMLVDSLSFDPA